MKMMTHEQHGELLLDFLTGTVEGMVKDRCEFSDIAIHAAMIAAAIIDMGHSLYGIELKACHDQMISSINAFVEDRELFKVAVLQ